MSEPKQRGYGSNTEGLVPGTAQLFVRSAEFAVVHFFWLASMVAAALFVFNIPTLYRHETMALDTVRAGLAVEGVIPPLAPALILAASVMLVVCLLATVITVGGIVIQILGNDPIGWLDREIERLKASCPLFGSTLPLSAWLACRSRLSALRTVYWAFLLSVGVTTINVLVIVSFAL